MTTAQELHRQAMFLAQDAIVERETGLQSKARELTKRAAEIEVEAARMLPRERRAEPTRSMLFRSAASLAFQLGDYTWAKQLVGEGLSGYPTPMVEDQLMGVLEQIRFQEMLSARDLQIDDRTLALHIRGPVVDFGRISYPEFKTRMDALGQMVSRTGLRQQGEEYRRSGQPRKAFNQIIPMITAFTPGSFIVDVQLAYRKNMLFDDIDRVAEEVVKGVEFVQSANVPELERMIPDKAYYRSFVQAAKQLAPDGVDISSVSLSYASDLVVLSKTRDELSTMIVPEPQEELSESTIELWSGVLNIADGPRQQVSIQLDSGKRRHMEVTEGLDDVVLSYWNQPVVATVRVTGSRNLLEDIKPDTSAGDSSIPEL
jgi:hypothetical protein